MDVCLLWVLCVVRWRSLRRADHSSRGVLPTVVCHCMWSRTLVNEEAWAQWGLKKKKTKTNKKNLYWNGLLLGDCAPWLLGTRGIRTEAADRDAFCPSRRLLPAFPYRFKHSMHRLIDFRNLKWRCSGRMYRTLLTLNAHLLYTCVPGYWEVGSWPLWCVWSNAVGNHQN
jgi:hypothetical protein